MRTWPEAASASLVIVSACVVQIWRYRFRSGGRGGSEVIPMTNRGEVASVSGDGVIAVASCGESNCMG